MQVALEALAFLLADVDDARAGLAQLDDVRPELRVQPAVLETQPGGGSDGAQQLGLVLQRRVVQEHRHMSSPWSMRVVAVPLSASGSSMRRPS